MPNTCPQCGAILGQESNCQAIFESFLVLEYTDPGYGAVHMLTVACYMIQHGRYSDEGLKWIEQSLREYLEGGIPADQIRRKAARETDQGRRIWAVTRRPDATPLPVIAWSMTIADVAAGYQDAKSYRKLVEQWARITLREMKPLIIRQ